MPTISVFYGMTITMYWRDHAPPHFHVRYGDARCTIDIQLLELLDGKLPRRAEKLAIEWASGHQAELMEDWRLCQLKMTPNEIEPLR